TRRQFREIARVAGLVFQGYPGQGKSARALQASSGLVYDVFAEYDPQNLLLMQAVREVMERQLEASRLHVALKRMRSTGAVITRPHKPTPFAFPLMVEVFRDRLSTEELAARVERMVKSLEAAAKD
ncbi:MAG: DNA ligase-associated DEXH box helicase, partial [Betaproteobacteria bacterium]